MVRKFGKSDGQTASRCLDKAVLAAKGGSLDKGVAITAGGTSKWSPRCNDNFELTYMGFLKKTLLSHRLRITSPLSEGSEQRGGGHIWVPSGVPLSTSGPGPGVSAPWQDSMYVWDGPSGFPELPEPVDAHQRRMWPVTHPVRSVLRELYWRPWLATTFSSTWSGPHPDSTFPRGWRSLVVEPPV